MTDQAAECSSRTPFWVVFLAPGLALLRPARAARMTANGSTAAFACCFLLHGALIGAAIALIMMWSETEQWSWNRNTTPTTTLVRIDGSEIHTRSMAEVWRAWHARSWFGTAEATLVSITLLVPLLAAVCAWVHLPTVHRRGSIWHSYRRSFRGVASCVGVLLSATTAAGLTVAWMSRLEDRRMMGPIPAADSIPYDLIGVVAIEASVVFVLWMVGCAVRGVSGERVEIDIHPRCEQCGYNLTHVGQDNRCPECGTDAKNSLEPNQWRPGCVWEERGGLDGWMVTSVAILLHPRQFYSRLKVRSLDDSPHAFANWHFFSIAAGTVVWFVGIFMTTQGGPSKGSELILVPCMFALMVLSLAWGVRRLATGIAASWLLHTREMADFGWVRRVVDYEIAFLWAFCVFDGLIVSALISSNRMFQLLFMRRAFFWMPLGPTLLIFGNLALGLIWLWRYRIAARAIRWNNF